MLRCGCAPRGPTRSTDCTCNGIEFPLMLPFQFPFLLFLPYSRPRACTRVTKPPRLRAVNKKSSAGHATPDVDLLGQFCRVDALRRCSIFRSCNEKRLNGLPVCWPRVIRVLFLVFSAPPPTPVRCMSFRGWFF